MEDSLLLNHLKPSGGAKVSPYLYKYLYLSMDSYHAGQCEWGSLHISLPMFGGGAWPVATLHKGAWTTDDSKHYHFGQELCHSGYLIHVV